MMPLVDVVLIAEHEMTNNEVKELITRLESGQQLTYSEQLRVC